MIRFLIIVLGMMAAAFATADYTAREDVQQFLNEMHRNHQIDRPKWQRIFAKVIKQKKALRLIQRPAEKIKSWREYSHLFLTAKRVQRGVQFWRNYRHVLAHAEEMYGVPAELILAIIGVETYYGYYKGKYSVLDTLTTLSFDYPPRQKFFRSELKAFILLADKNVFGDHPPRSIKGSYAGAMGYGQFIPSSYKHYAVDFDGDDTINLMDSAADAIGSVANYIAVHHWQRGKMVAVSAIPFADYEPATYKKIKPRYSVADLASKGLVSSVPLAADQLVAPLLLDDEIWLGLPNFYAISRYNPSSMYAMAVYHLSLRLKLSIEAEQAK